MFYSDPTLESLHPMALGQHERQPRLSYISGQMICLLMLHLLCWTFINLFGIQNPIKSTIYKIHINIDSRPPSVLIDICIFGEVVDF